MNQPTNEPFEVYPVPSSLKFEAWILAGSTIFLILFAVWLTILAVRPGLGPDGVDFLSFAAVPTVLAAFIAACVVATIAATLHLRRRLVAPEPILIISDDGFWYENWTNRPIPWAAIEAIGRGMVNDIVIKFNRDRLAGAKFRWSAPMHPNWLILPIKLAYFYLGRRLGMSFDGMMTSRQKDEIIAAIKRHATFNDAP